MYEKLISQLVHWKKYRKKRFWSDQLGPKWFAAEFFKVFCLLYQQTDFLVANKLIKLSCLRTWTVTCKKHFNYLFLNDERTISTCEHRHSLCCLLETPYSSASFIMLYIRKVRISKIYQCAHCHRSKPFVIHP